MAILAFVRSLVDTSLVAYGTLRPGEVNHWLVRKLEGRWYTGTITGFEFEISWGAAEGYPGVVLDPDGQVCEVSLLVSEKLDKHWYEIDQFEGEGYRRVPVEVTVTGELSESAGDKAVPAAIGGDLIEPGMTVLASVYEAVQDNPD